MKINALDDDIIALTSVTNVKLQDNVQKDT